MIRLFRFQAGGRRAYPGCIGDVDELARFGFLDTLARGFQGLVRFGRFDPTLRVKEKD
jgi:hypothetical protein